MKSNRGFTNRPDRDRFARLVLMGIRNSGEKREVVYDRSLAGEASNTMFLDNAYAEYCNSSDDERDTTLARIVRNWFVFGKSTPEEFEDASHDLLPVVRSRGFYSDAELMLKAEGQKAADVPYQQLGDDLAVALVYDLPEAMRTIGQKDLDCWGVSLYEALEVARQNLSRLPCKFIGPDEGEGVYLSVTNDNYDSARLLLLDLIRGFKVKGDPIAMVPNRDTLIVTGAEDEAGLKGMMALANDALKKPRPIAGLALRLDGDDWLPWMPPRSRPHFHEFRRLQIWTYSDFYGHQKTLLDKLHESTGEDIFVASYGSAEKEETAEAWSYCVWAKGVLALLPKTDKIMFMGEGLTPRVAEWDRVVAAANDLIEPIDMYPERYRVAAFPSEQQLAAMGAGSIE